MKGWYIRQDSILLGESALVQVNTSGLYVQFDNLALPSELTHGWTPMPADAMVVEIKTIADKITLYYKGKQFTRTVRNGYFDFRGIKLRS